MSHCTFQLFMQCEAIDHHATAARLLVRKMVTEVNIVRERRAKLGEAIAKLLAQPSIELRLAGLKVCVPFPANVGSDRVNASHPAVHLCWAETRLPRAGVALVGVLHSLAARRWRSGVAPFPSL